MIVNLRPLPTVARLCYRHWSELTFLMFGKVRFAAAASSAAAQLALTHSLLAVAQVERVEGHAAVLRAKS